MILSWRRRKPNPRKELPAAFSDMELIIPTHFRCPISLELMKDPVTLSTGITYDRESIEKWIDAGNATCPVTNQDLTTFDLIPNHSIRRMIQDWCVENRSHGIERIPTPRIPVTPYDVSELCSKIEVAIQRSDGRKCQLLVGKIKTWGRESERNKRCIVECGAGSVLAASFEHFASASVDENPELLKEILWVLTWMFPLGMEGRSRLGSAVSLQCVASFLKGKDLSARQSSVLVVKELVSADQRYFDALAEIEGLAEALMNMVKEPLSVTATKASLTVIFYMIPPSAAGERMGVRFVELGLVSQMLEFLVDAERSLCEKALGILDRICFCKEGREAVVENALAMPVLVKKMLRISVLATEFSISILWKVWKEEKRDDDEEEVVGEAVQVGAFQRLLVLLQVGCDNRTKERVSELLKLFNQYRGKLPCFDSSMDFKYLKKPF